MVLLSSLFFIFELDADDNNNSLHPDLGPCQIYCSSDIHAVYFKKYSLASSIDVFWLSFFLSDMTLKCSC